MVLDEQNPMRHEAHGSGNRLYHNAIEPVLNPIWAAFFYGKLLRRLSFIGAVIVLRGILYYNLITESKV